MVVSIMLTDFDCRWRTFDAANPDPASRDDGWQCRVCVSVACLMCRLHRKYEQGLTNTFYSASSILWSHRAACACSQFEGGPSHAVQWDFRVGRLRQVQYHGLDLCSRCFLVRLLFCSFLSFFFHFRIQGSTRWKTDSLVNRCGEH